MAYDKQPLPKDYSSPVPAESCSDSSGNTIHVQLAGVSDVELVEDDDIKITDLSTSSVKKFKIGRPVAEELTGTLSLTAKESTVVKSIPILKGITIDEVTLDWSYNKSNISTQVLTRSDGGSVPLLTASDRTATHTVAITSNVTYTLTTDDSDGKQVIKTSSITFGNSRHWGHGSSMIGKTKTDLDTLIATLNNETNTSKSKTVNPTGGVGEYWFYGYPASYGLPTIEKEGVGGVTGNFPRLLLVNGTFKYELASGETETSVMITNSEGYEEEYYFFQSFIDNQDDPENALIIS